MPYETRHLIGICLALVTFTFSRTLFNIPSEELDSVREEASRLLREAEIPAHSHLSLPTPPGHVKHVDDGTRDIPNFRVRKTVRSMRLAAERGVALSIFLSDTHITSAWRWQNQVTTVRLPIHHCRMCMSGDIRFRTVETLLRIYSCIEPEDVALA